VKVKVFFGQLQFGRPSQTDIVFYIANSVAPRCESLRPIMQAFRVYDYNNSVYSQYVSITIASKHE